MKTPEKVIKALADNQLSVEMYDHRNINYRGKLYTIHRSQSGGYYATFTAHYKKSGDNTPVFWTWRDNA